LNRSRAGDNKARNVMISKHRSNRARSLEDKYSVNWGTVLGEGAYGEVFLAKNRQTRTEVALKKINKQYTESVLFKTETEALLKIHENGGHPNICGLRDMYENKSHYFLVFDLVPGGEMFEHLINYGAYSEADASRLMREVASALAFLHGINVVHADLKPENIMLSSSMTSDGTIKIVDFGSAVSLTDEERLQNELRKSFKARANGTTAYWSPERFEQVSDAAAPADMWGVGVVLFIMLAGVHPYDLECNATDDDIAVTMCTNPNPPISPYLDDISDSAVDLIQKLLEPDPTKRLNAADMLKHPWVTGETASRTKITNSDRKLFKYENFRAEIESGIFQAMLTPPSEMAGGTDIIKKAFDVFDAEGKGFVTSGDVSKVVKESTGKDVSMDSKSKNLSLSEFSKLAFSELKYQHYNRNDIIVTAGDLGSSMFFIRSGMVELITDSGLSVCTLKVGEFFGEECVLQVDKMRSSTVKCCTPVDLIEITQDDFERFTSSSTGGKVLLETAFCAKTLGNTKSLIRCCHNIQRFNVRAGTIIYSEQSTGDSMYLIEEGVVDMTQSGKRAFSVKAGEVFGERALLTQMPREATAICAEDCILSEIRGEDFLAVLESSPETAQALRDINRKRMFKQAASSAANRSFSLPNLQKAFDAVDANGDGYLNYEEIRQVVLKLDSTYPEDELTELMKSIDLNSDSEISFKEFEQIFKWCM